MSKLYYWSMAQRDYNIYKSDKLKEEFLYYAHKNYSNYKALGGKRKLEELEEIS